MNRKTAQILTLAALSSFSAAAMAFGAKTAVKTETRIQFANPKMDLKIENPASTEIKVGNTLNMKSDIVVPAKKADLQGKGCDASIFDRVAKDTSVDAATWRMLQARGAINVYNLGCDPNPEAFEHYSADARDVAGLTEVCALNNGLEKAAGLDARAAIGGPCMRDVKFNKGQTDVTVEAATADWKKVSKKCNIFPENGVTAQ